MGGGATPVADKRKKRLLIEPLFFMIVAKR